MLKLSIFANQNSSNNSELANQAALFCINPNIPNFSLVTKRVDNWHTVIYQSSLEIIKTEHMSLEETDHILKTLRDYCIATSEASTPSASVNSLKKFADNSSKMYDYLQGCNYEAAHSLLTVDQLKEYSFLADLPLQSWFQNKFQDNASLIQKLEFGRLKLTTRIQNKLFNEDPDALFLLDFLEREHAAGLYTV